MSFFFLGTVNKTKQRFIKIVQVILIRSHTSFSNKDTKKEKHIFVS